MDYDVKKIISQFALEGDLVSFNPEGNGHINDTFKVSFANGNSTTNYILQRINQYVFKEPEKLMDNYVRVTSHIKKKVEAAGKDVMRNCLTSFPTKDGKHFLLDENGNYWRVINFIESNIAFEFTDNPQVAFECSKAVGEFQSWLVDLPGGPLHETIPYFNNPRYLYNQFLKILEKDACNRAKNAKELIDIVEKNGIAMQRFVVMGEEGRLPLRTTHNDTKINNILLDKDTLKAICIIDLDTVMSGYALNDFGDAVRTLTNTGKEDDPNLDNVGVNLTMFEAYTKGYLSTAKSFLIKEELENLAFAAKLYPYIIGLRFISDYLDGDNYFKIGFPEHNLQRAKAQFKLMSEMEKNYDKLEKIVKDSYANL